MRSSRRLRVLQQAKIVFGTEAMIHCEVRDISADGAKIAIRRHVELPDTFELFIAAQDLRVHTASLRWRKDGFVGVSFKVETGRDTPAVKALPPLSATIPDLIVRTRRKPCRTEPECLSGGMLIDRDLPLSKPAHLYRATIQPGRAGSERRRRTGRRNAI